jgi:hypothetical protein
LFSCLFSLFFFEIYARINHEKFYSYGWQVDNIASDKISACKKQGGDKAIVGVFGDSFVEFYGNQPENLVVQLNNASNSMSYFCNFGVSGAGIPIYASRFKAAINAGIKMNSAIFYLYEGNDFVEFLDTSKKSENRYEDLSDRKLNLVMSIIKGSYSINIIYREILKPIFFQISITRRLLGRYFRLVFIKNPVLMKLF